MFKNYDERNLASEIEILFFIVIGPVDKADKFSKLAKV
jgi:hypothetical protein